MEQRLEPALDADSCLAAFLELEWLKLDDAAANHGGSVASITGRNAFGRLFSEVTASLTFTMENAGKKEDLDFSQILRLFSPAYALR